MAIKYVVIYDELESDCVTLTSNEEWFDTEEQADTYAKDLQFDGTIVNIRIVTVNC